MKDRTMQTASSLTLLGKEAAAKYLEHGIPLNDAIRQIKEAHGLNDEETRRVIERANVAVTLHKYHTCPGDDRAVTFEVADPYVILGEKTASEAQAHKRFRRIPEGNFHLEKVARSFRVPGAQGEKRAHFVSSVREAIRSMYPNIADDQFEKQAHVQESPNMSLSQVVAAVDVVVSAAHQARHRYDECRHEFQKAAETTLRNGTTVCELIEALLPFAKSGEHLAELKPVIDVLSARGLVKEGALRPLPPPPNPNHPVVRAFIKLGQAADELSERTVEAEYAKAFCVRKKEELADAFVRQLR